MDQLDNMDFEMYSVKKEMINGQIKNNDYTLLLCKKTHLYNVDI